MTALDALRALQHDDLVLTSDHVLAAFLTGADPAIVRLDLTPVTAIERRMLNAHRRTA